MKRYIYADNAATTKLDAVAFEAMKPFLLDEYGNPSQLYSFSRIPKRAIQEARETIASCIGALPEEIFFTSGGTESDNWAIKGAAFLNGQRRSTITTSFEHHAILHSCKAIEQQGYPIVYLGPTNDGYITGEILKGYTKDKPFIVSVMYANNEIGTVQPIKELCTIAHKSGSLFHTDAVQAIGHVPINVHNLDVDMLSASAHKFNGPKGIGFLYIKKGIKIPSYIDGGAQELKRRAGTENVAGIVGMAVALKQNCDHLQENSRHIEALEFELISRLNAAGVDYIRNGGENRLPGFVSLSFIDMDGEAILHRMDLSGICVSTGSACNSVSAEISHVLKAIRLTDEYAKGTVRISLGKENSQDDVETISQAIRKIVCT